MFRRFLLAVVLFLVIIVIVADRVGAIAGAHVLAGKIQTDEHLDNRPSVTIKGIPFLTQAFGGKYSDVHLTDHDVVINEVPVTTLTVDLHGVHLPFRKVISGGVSRVPVDRVTGTAFVSFSDANDYLAHHLPSGVSIRLAPGGGGRIVSIVDRVRVGGKRVVLHGSGAVSVSNNVVGVDVSQLTPSSVNVPGQVLHQALTEVAVSFPLQGLPFKLALTGVSVTPAGLTGAGSATHVVLGAS